MKFTIQDRESLPGVAARLIALAWLVAGLQARSIARLRTGDIAYLVVNIHYYELIT
jgi:hypothetical protein